MSTRKLGRGVAIVGAGMSKFGVRADMNSRELFVEAFNDMKASVDKGIDTKIDSYSGFFDNANLRRTDLDDFLKKHQVTEIDLSGLATDYCVKFTALDAVKLGYQTRLITAGCRGVDLNPGDVDKALDELKNAGVIIS